MSESKVVSKNVLLVTNAITDGEILLIKEAVSHAKEQKLDIHLNLVHVIPNLPACYFNIPSMVLLTESYYEEGSGALTTIGESLNIAKKNQWLITGKIRAEVLRLASRLRTHFILASHTSIQDLHKSFLFMKKEANPTPIRSIGSLVRI
ncbi:MAG TPA: hypothetical protein VLJ15_07635 [Gammaproteobacteria bacterium]|nr:hypothetical protein [Gammaproteobacteria bacterium]